MAIDKLNPLAQEFLPDTSSLNSARTSPLESFPFRFGSDAQSKPKPSFEEDPSVMANCLSSTSHLPIKAIPFTLRSSSLKPSGSTDMAPVGSGLNRSRYAPSTSSTEKQPKAIWENHYSFMSDSGHVKKASTGHETEREAPVHVPERASSVSSKNTFDKNITYSRALALLNVHVESLEEPAAVNGASRISYKDTISPTVSQLSSPLTTSHPSATRGLAEKNTEPHRMAQSQSASVPPANTGHVEKLLEDLMKDSSTKREKLVAEDSQSRHILNTINSTIEHLENTKLKAQSLIDSCGAALNGLQEVKGSLEPDHAHTHDDHDETHAKLIELSELMRELFISVPPAKAESVKPVSSNGSPVASHGDDAVKALPPTTDNKTPTPIADQFTTPNQVVETKTSTTQNITAQLEKTGVHAVKVKAPAVGYRHVMLENLPKGCTPNSITRIVYGGRILQFSITPEATTANVQFLQAQDAEKYLASAAKGIRWPTQPGRVIRVSRVEQPDAPNAYELALIGGRYSRVVQLINLPADVGKNDMTSFASEGNRQIEEIREKRGNGNTAFQVSFLRLADGITFMSAVHKKYKDSKGISVQWGPDPCEAAKNVH